MPVPYASLQNRSQGPAKCPECGTVEFTTRERNVTPADFHGISWKIQKRIFVGNERIASCSAVHDLSPPRVAVRNDLDPRPVTRVSQWSSCRRHHRADAVPRQFDWVEEDPLERIDAEGSAGFAPGTVAETSISVPEFFVVLSSKVLESQIRITIHAPRHPRPLPVQ